MVRAFQQAMATAVILIALLLYLMLRDLGDVALVLGPLALAGCYTVACMVVVDIPFNFANVITLPLLLGIGVDNGIHMVRRWRAEPTQLTNIVRTSTARAVVVSALTTICSFGNLGVLPSPRHCQHGASIEHRACLQSDLHPCHSAKLIEMAIEVGCESQAMTNLDRVSLAKTFGNDADGYERARPAYPSSLIDFVGSLLPKRPAQIVEVGCGSGKATNAIAPFAARLVAIDNSPELLDIAKRLSRESASLEFVCANFEDAKLAIASYDAVVSAQAFHWIDPRVGLRKVADILHPGGLLALFWNYAALDQQPTLLRCRNAALKVAPHFDQWADSSNRTFNLFADEWLQTLNRQATFSGCLRKDFHWSLHWSTDTVLDWFTTHSWWRALPVDSRSALTVELSKILSAGDNHHHVMPFKSLLVYGFRQ